MLRPGLLAIAIALLTGAPACSGVGEHAEGGADPGWVECVVPRPEVCAEEWRPVCGLRDTGVRCVTTPCPSWETRTYSNACSACTDAAVFGWRPDACVSEGTTDG